jgi:hypothetical protein
MTTSRSFLRHTLGTVAYRGGKCLRDVPAGFSDFSVGPSSRTPGQILAHVCDLYDWALWLAKGTHTWKDSAPQAWEADVDRFYAALGALDAYLASRKPLGFPAEKIFQGPVADSLTHIGQIAMLRRLAGGRVRAENYFKAKIEIGQVGARQPKPNVEF